MFLRAGPEWGSATKAQRGITQPCPCAGPLLVPFWVAYQVGKVHTKLRNLCDKIYLYIGILNPLTVRRWVTDCFPSVANWNALWFCVRLNKFQSSTKGREWTLGSGSLYVTTVLRLMWAHCVQARLLHQDVGSGWAALPMAASHSFWK